MLLEAIYHKPYSEYAFALDDDTLVIRIRTKKEDFKKVYLVYHEKYNTAANGSLPMKKIAEDELFDYYEAKVEKGFKRIKYMFYLEGTYSFTWFDANGFHDKRPEWGLFTYANTHAEDKMDTPDWWSSSVIYQIFPDRFYNPACMKVKEWSKLEKNLFSYFGGSIEGIIAKIDYLMELGINVVYLNPVFKSNSYHRYDIVDFYSADPSFGNKAQLKAFIGLCHQKGIRVIFDGVFNHCSRDFFAFKDVMAKGEKSIYKDWFIIESFPVRFYPKPNFECFAYYSGMPKLNTSNKDVIKYFCDVAAYWIEEFGIDGWRLDVADELGRGFIRKLRERVKMSGGKNVLIGEIWDEGSSWLKGDQLDSCLNYPLKSCINDLFAYRSIDAEKLKTKLNNNIMLFKSDVLDNMVSIIGTHDTSRFLTLCEGDRKRFSLAVVFQFTFPGVPLIYYGDEIGMKGGDDPFCRLPMEWDESLWDLELLQLYKDMIALKRYHPALSTGEFSFIAVKGSSGMLSYMRKNRDEAVIVVMNTTDKIIKGAIEIDRNFEGIKSIFDITGNKTVNLAKGTLKLELKPYQWQIFKTVPAETDN